MKWKPVDVIVLIITCVVSFILGALAFKPFFTEVTMPVESAKLLAGLLGSLISIISMYIGASIQKKKDE